MLVHKVLTGLPSGLAHRAGVDQIQIAQPPCHFELRICRIETSPAYAAGIVGENGTRSAVDCRIRFPRILMMRQVRVAGTITAECRPGAQLKTDHHLGIRTVA